MGGNPVVVKRTTNFPVEHEIPIKRTKEKLIFQGIPTFHDKFLGRRRGPNTSWVWHMEGVRYCFIGDIGHLLSEQQLALFGGDCDVLFLPVGGLTTVDPDRGGASVNQPITEARFPDAFHDLQ